MGIEAGGVQARGIGARLRAAREKKGLTLLQSAEKLHVDARVLEALEAEDFGALGADVYVRGHLRRYAELTGESASELQQLYADTGRSVRPDLTRIPHSEAPPRSSRLMLPALLLVVGCALAGALWWLLTLPGQKAQPVPAMLPPAAPADAPPQAQTPSTAPTRTQPVPPPMSAAPDAAPAGAAGSAQLQLRFSAPSWVEVSDAEGRRLLHGLMEGGSTHELRGSPPLRVVLGNAPAVALQLDGRALSVAALVHRDGSAHLSIDAAGNVTAAAPRLAHGE
jgi:cytoskeleton protein RodZ